MIIAARLRATAKLADTEKKCKELGEKILVVTSSAIPGKELDIIGVVSGVSDTAASFGEEFKLAEKEALYNLMNRALELGANGVVDLKMSTGSYQQQGSQWMVSKVTYTGTAVLIKR
ncbi:MAG: heavy metal-binding domain-containing protein [Thermodesulfobacteriota bacterium]|nr:MAG: heavy metal-binding domain-containing protein [Thermodesulfobacteriota bacterium]